MASIAEAMSIAVEHHRAGRLQAAEQVYRLILQAEPDHADALHLLGVVAAQMGNQPLAIEYMGRAIAINANVAAYHSNLGGAYRSLGKLPEALACHHRALSLQPNYAEGHNNLGTVLADLGRMTEAEASYRRAVELQPDFAGAHDNLGSAMKALGRLDEATACHRRALALQPNHAMAMNNLGTALEQMGHLDEAIACYRRTIEIRPDHVTAMNNLGVALQKQGNLEKAVACYQRAIALRPEYVEAHNNLGNALKEQRKLDEAVAVYRRAVELNPDHVGVYNNLGLALRDQGKFDEAVSCYRKSIIGCRRLLQTAARSADVWDRLGNAYFQLAFILGDRLPNDELIAMRDMLTEQEASAEGRILVEFGLARALDARGDFAEAAEHLCAANRLRSVELRSQHLEFKPDDHRNFVDDLMANCTPQFFERTSGFGLQTELPVFIVGLPRSGTTLVEQILASHSRVFGAGEFLSFESTFRSLPKAMRRDVPAVECLRDIDRKTVVDLAQRIASQMQALDAKALRVVDKTFDNFQHLALIGTLFPRAKIIHCRRDLRDVALSCLMTKFTTIAWAREPDHIVVWFDDYRRLMDFWKRVLPTPMLDVEYEELVEDTDVVARRVIEWCGLEWEPQCLRFHETQRVVRSGSSVQVRQSIYTSSVGRWKNYETSLGELFLKVDRHNW